MTDANTSIVAFYASWAPTFVFASSENRASPAELVIVAGGFEWPVVTLGLAAIGVLAARLIAPKRDVPIGLAKNILVTLIMLVAALLWVLDSRPGLLFAFVVSIGLGFSGYTVIELLGEEIAAYIKRAIGALPLPGLKAGQTTKPDQEPS